MTWLPFRANEFSPGYGGFVNSAPDMMGSCCAVFSFLCSALKIIVCPFSFGHCIDCHSIYDFWLPIMYPQTFHISHTRF